MYLHALASAVPHARYTQAQCWELARNSSVRQRLSRKSMFVLQAVLCGDSGVNTRHFAVPEIDRVFDYTPDELNTAFQREAPQLAARALKNALAQIGSSSGEIDALLVCTCTGYLCPGVSSYVSEQLGLRPNAFLQDIVGLGCGAAIPMLRAAQGVLAVQPDALVACVAVEVCSAAFYLDDDLGVLISACLFGDGAAATLWRSTPGASGLRCSGFDTFHSPADRDRIRFEQRNGKLRNLLDASVPAIAGDAVSRLLQAERQRPGAKPIARILSHGGGRDVLKALETSLDQPDLTPTRDVLLNYGNMSSPSVLFALENALKTGAPADNEDWWLVSFGAGFSVHGCRLGKSSLPA